MRLRKSSCGYRYPTIQKSIHAIVSVIEARGHAVEFTESFVGQICNLPAWWEEASRCFEQPTPDPSEERMAD